MLTKDEITVIRQSLENGYDVEIQQRKNGIAILQMKKIVRCLPGGKVLNDESDKDRGKKSYTNE